MQPHGAGARRLGGWGLALLLLPWTSCAPPSLALASPERLKGGPFAFLEDGRTTREESLLRLGTPSVQLEQARILSYTYVSREGAFYLRVGRVAWPSAVAPAYRAQAVVNLVLVFDGAGVLRRHSLVVPE